MYDEIVWAQEKNTKSQYISIKVNSSQFEQDSYLLFIRIRIILTKI